MSRKDKIQQLLILHLLEEGHIQLNLPDGMKVELGIVKEGKHGTLKKQDDYCWLIAQHKDREVSIDSYNLGLRFADTDSKMLIEDSIDEIEDGHQMRSFCVV